MRREEGSVIETRSKYIRGGMAEAHLSLLQHEFLSRGEKADNPGVKGKGKGQRQEASSADQDIDQTSTSHSTMKLRIPTRTKRNQVKYLGMWSSCI